MRFYYASIFSQAVWIVYCVVAIPLFWLILRAIRGRLTVLSASLSAFIVAALPWSEEWWIAYNFAQMCQKDAGVFINKIVTVDGYYNDTGTITRLVGGPKYRFVEAPEAIGHYRRVERATQKERDAAIAWYAKSNGEQPDEKLWFTQQVSDRVKIAVEMDTGYTWRIMTLDHPTARYHYKTLNSHTPVALRIKRFENVVIDSQTHEVLGRYVDYARGPYWFFVSLGAPTMSCEETRVGTRKYDSLIYRAVLLPEAA
jgi:hypothetical protein